MSALLVITNLPTAQSAQKLAAQLLDLRLAACINLLAPCRSSYHWAGKLQHEEEFPMLIKTSSDRYAALEAAIKAGHPYEVPEIIAMPITAGLPAYLDWVQAETRGAE